MAITGNDERKRPRPHISGWAAAALITFVGSIAGLATWATSDANSHKFIGEQAGLIVAIGLAGVFFVAAMGPSWQRAMPGAGALVDRIGDFFLPLGSFLSAVDTALVRWIAPIGGAKLTYAVQRYAALVVHLGGSAVAAWLLQQHRGELWPFQQTWTVADWASFIPIVWGFAVAFSISRRWAWIEQDRETAMITSVYEVGPDSALRIGFAQDLRDEALLSFMFIFLFVPLTLSQLSHYNVFRYAVGFEPHYLDWLGFFGAELAKAVPFVDWAEVYNIGSQSRISVVAGAGQHVIFAVRVMTDLILLAALVQALQISGRISAQKREFSERRLNRLDPFLERAEFSRLAAGDMFADSASAGLKKFTHYDQVRLTHLARSGSTPSLRAVALRLLVEQRAPGAFELLDERLSGRGEHQPDKSEEVQRLAAELIAASDDERRGSCLIRAIQTRNYVKGANTFSVHLADLMARLPSASRVPALVKVLSEAGHQDVRRAALNNLLIDVVPDMRVTIVEAVSGRIDPPDQAKDVRRDAVTALKGLKIRRHAASALAAALNGNQTRPRDTDRSVRRRAVEALRVLGGVEARSALEVASRDAEPSIASAAAAAMDELVSEGNDDGAATEPSTG